MERCGRAMLGFATAWSMLAGAAWAQAPGLPSAPVIGAAALPRDLSPWGMFVSADGVVKAVIIGLVAASIVTWTIWLAKTIEISLAKRQGRAALAALVAARSFADAHRAAAAGPAGDFLAAAASELELSTDTIDENGLKERIASRRVRRWLR